MLLNNMCEGGLPYPEINSKGLLPVLRGIRNPAILIKQSLEGGHPAAGTSLRLVPAGPLSTLSTYRNFEQSQNISPLIVPQASPVRGILVLPICLLARCSSPGSLPGPACR